MSKSYFLAAEEVSEYSSSALWVGLRGSRGLRLVRLMEPWT